MSIPPSVVEVAEQIKERLSFETYSVASPIQYTHAARDLRTIKEKFKELETLRKSMTRPLDESKAQIMNFFRAPLATLERAERIIKERMLEYQRNRINHLAAMSEEERADLVALGVTLRPEAAGISERNIWRFRIVDPALVPEDFLVIDEAKLARIARIGKGTIPVPGVEFYEEKILAARPLERL